MARIVETEKVVKKKKKQKIIVIFVAILLVVLAAFIIFKMTNKKSNNSPIEIKLLDSNEKYGYSLSDKDTELFKKEYDVLKDVLKKDSVDTKAYATQVSKLFIIDLYTLSNKINKYDIGGSDFFHKEKETMFESKVMDSLYSTLKDNTYGDRKQELPEVSNIEVVSVEENNYKMNDKEEDGFLVKLKWSYVKDMGYDDEGSIVVVSENGTKWSVVDYQPTLEPKYDEKKTNSDD